jgi:hypothetical protein
MKKETYLLVSTIIISSIVTIASSLSLILSYNFALNILSAVLAGLTTGINIYTKNDNAEQKITKHANSARGYREIVSRLEKELVLDLEHRTNGNDLINIISEQMLNLETGSESIPLITPEEYNRLDSTKHIIHSTTTYRFFFPCLSPGSMLFEACPRAIVCLCFFYFFAIKCQLFRKL